MTSLPPERQVRRAGDPDPCAKCGGGRCQLCNGWGATGGLEGKQQMIAGILHMGEWVSRPCPHKCRTIAPYFYGVSA